MASAMCDTAVPCPAPGTDLVSYKLLQMSSTRDGNCNKHLNWTRTALMNSRKVASKSCHAHLLKSSVSLGCLLRGQVPPKDCTRSQIYSVHAFWSARSPIIWNNPILSAGNLRITWKMSEFLYPLPQSSLLLATLIVALITTQKYGKG